MGCGWARTRRCMRSSRSGGGCPVAGQAAVIACAAPMVAGAGGWLVSVVGGAGCVVVMLAVGVVGVLVGSGVGGLWHPPRSRWAAKVGWVLLSVGRVVGVMGLVGVGGVEDGGDGGSGSGGRMRGGIGGGRAAAAIWWRAWR